MPKTKNVKFSDEKPPSPTPRCFREPEGMTDVDLRRLSEMSAFSDASFKKVDARRARRALCRTLLLVVACVAGGMALLLLFASPRGSTTLQQLFRIEPRPQPEVGELVAYYAAKLSRCKRERSLEACCAIIADTGGELQDCSIDRIVKAIENRDEMDAIDAYIHPDFIKNVLRDSYALVHAGEANRAQPQVRIGDANFGIESRPKRQLRVPEHRHPDAGPNLPPYHSAQPQQGPIARPQMARILANSQRMQETASKMRETMQPLRNAEPHHNNNHEFRIVGVASHPQPEINHPLPRPPRPELAPNTKNVINYHPVPVVLAQNPQHVNYSPEMRPLSDSKKQEFRNPLNDVSFRGPQNATKLALRLPGDENNEEKGSVKEPTARQNNAPNQQASMVISHGPSLPPAAPCFATFTPPSVGSPLSLVQQQVQPVQYDPSPKFAQLVPISVARSQANPYLINAGYTYFAPQPLITSMNAGVHPGGGLGPYYICNPLPGQSPNNIAGMAGVEVRSNDDLRLLAPQRSAEQRALTRQSGMCGVGQEMCADESKCISSARVCDDTVNCEDGSDEAFCSCRFRVSSARTCDAYLDCPHGEDEIACRGCGVGFFNCDDWTEGRDATCVPIKQRCDATPDCPTGKDEQDCAVLLDAVDESTDVFKVSNSEGFLHRNHRGRWYPVCSDGEEWVQELCRTELDSARSRPALVQQIPVNPPYEGSFVGRGPDGRVQLLDGCANGMALHAQCPPPVCGVRKVVANAYRAEEVDTSEEEIAAQFRGARAAPANDSLVGDGRVVGGRACQPAAWPWVASIYRNGAFHCGGALIADSWLMTAAHCVDRYWHYYYEIELGMLRRFSFSPMQQTRYASDVVAHAGYDRAKLENDLALMRLSAPVRYNRYVRPICLPTELTAGRGYANAPPAGALCTAVGWGATAEHGTDPDHLREVEVPVLRHCKHKQDADGNEICAGLLQGGKDACQGDSGGPFLCRNPNLPDQWYLAGIVSHGEGCARPDEPGVYTRVSMYVDWIYEHTRDDALPQRRPLRRCPGYTCKGIRKCIPSKRRCDRLVDCLYGDDEADCDHRHRFSTLYKQAMDLMTFRGRTPAGEASASGLPRDEDSSNATESIVGAAAEGSRFLCEKMLQVIPIAKKCDRVIDCQDGSDESSCTCADYLRLSHADALCDGTTDCSDLSDEKDCAPSCGDSSRFYCRLSRACIPMARRCDNTPDCAHAEDEWDCFALTANYRMRLDADDRPLVNSKGLLSYYAAGEWRPMCGNFSGVEGALAADVCVSLGLTDYDRFLQLRVRNAALPTISADHTMRQTAASSETAPTCNGLFVQCANTSSASAHHVAAAEDPLSALSELAIAPWSAAVHADGAFECTGALLTADWLLTSVHCFPGILSPDANYLAARLGAGRGYPNVQGPHEQVVPVLQRIRVAASDAVLLQLAHPVALSRYVKPLHFRNKGDFAHYRETCLATGRINETSAMVVLEARRNCTPGARCFARASSSSSSAVAPECQPHQQVREPWSGCIVCDAGNGFYPAAVFEEPLGSCGFNGTRPFLSVAAVRRDIVLAMERTPFVVEAPKCDGHRCPLGKCLAPAKVCDGIADCEDGSDERTDFCNRRNADCHLQDGCVCPPDAMRCNNSKCVKKYQFCDRTDDCGDGSDEPAICSCRQYLGLANPSMICDGVRNCQDRSDEDPDLCSCRPGLFECAKQCVAQEMVCDGYRDCKDGSDEEQCVSLKASDDDRRAGEVMTRTAGVWHSGCFPQHMTTSQLESVCAALGFTGSSASYWKVNVNDTAPQPRLQKFEHFWVHNTEATGRLILATRSGRDSFVSFGPASSQCFKLFIKCI